ncbi:MAG: aminotransferase class I/II-fold pyridoxal phosphate-dependent enzyme [Clostridia bacterium]|nr:aminotransferase class I/II-fold pyridoxal phosphate-dependent enzyme [Clostridia bacterium]
MIRFESDYTQGAVPQILDALLKTNMEQTPGYGEDKYCLSAADKIRKELGRDDLAVHFLVGGTQTNFTFIASCLRPHEGVISASTGHINVHETGAVEATGHKILPIPSFDGKINAQQIEEMVVAHENDASFEHITKPKMVYLSMPTENGTIYSNSELEAIYDCCKRKNLILYIDGARLGYALMCKENDVAFSDLPNLCDAFYIGGTKVGALFGEALVIVNDRYKEDFRYIEKQKGAMLAKGRLLGLQFDTLFTDGLYFEISKHAMKLADKIRDAFKEKGIKLLYDSPTNQLFPMLTDEEMNKLKNDFSFSYWGKFDGLNAVRFCTSWATQESDVAALLKAINEL